MSWYRRLAGGLFVLGTAAIPCALIAWIKWDGFLGWGPGAYVIVVLVAATGFGLFCLFEDRLTAGEDHPRATAILRALRRGRDAPERYVLYLRGFDYDLHNELYPIDVVEEVAGRRRESLVNVDEILTRALSPIGFVIGVAEPSGRVERMLTEHWRLFGTKNKPRVGQHRPGTLRLGSDWLDCVRLLAHNAELIVVAPLVPLMGDIEGVAAHVHVVDGVRRPTAEGLAEELEVLLDPALLPKVMFILPSGMTNPNVKNAFCWSLRVRFGLPVPTKLYDIQVPDDYTRGIGGGEPTNFRAPPDVTFLRLSADGGVRRAVPVHVMHYTTGVMEAVGLTDDVQDAPTASAPGRHLNPSSFAKWPEAMFEYGDEDNPGQVVRRLPVGKEALALLRQVLGKYTSAELRPKARLYADLGLVDENIGQLIGALEGYLGRPLPGFLRAMLRSTALEPRVIDVALEFARFPSAGQCQGRQAIGEPPQTQVGDDDDPHEIIRRTDASTELFARIRTGASMSTDRVIELFAMQFGLTTRSLLEEVDGVLRGWPAWREDMGGQLILKSTEEGIVVSEYALEVLARSIRLDLFHWYGSYRSFFTSQRRGTVPS